MAVEQTTLQASLDKGLAYLASVQRSDGGFDSYSSPSKTRFHKAFTYQTTFVPAVMLAALSGLQTPGGQRITRRLVGFVKDQRSPGWSFNYWAAASPERIARPYPDDLDDTACALISLWLYDPDLVGPGVLAAFIKLLLATEARVGGPYRTWLAPGDNDASWSDIDLAVNTNIAYFLSLVSLPLPNITALMEQAILDKQLLSPYYASTFPIIYYLARTYRGPSSKALRTIARQLRATGDRLTPLQNALSLSALLKLGDDKPAGSVAQLLTAQRADGSWPAEAFCLDPTRDGATHYHGSESLTTALVLEALAAYKQFTRAESSSTIVTARRAANPQHATFRAQVSTLNRRAWRPLKPELRASAMTFTQTVADASGNTEIVALPKIFNESLVRPLAKTDEPILVRLGLANLYGWAAYTIYDNFLDDEGRPDLLPVATAASRYCLQAFDAALPEDEDFKNYVRRTFDTIDGANAWELAHCRFERQGRQLIIAALPDYGDLTGLADRSLGHSLTPLAVLRAKGVKRNSRLFRGVHQAFIHYLAARQLNDDAHDWQTDLRNGHVTYVVTRLLVDTEIKAGRYDWNKLLPLVQKQFWHDTLPKICQDISGQTALSRRSLEGLPGLKRHNVLTKLLDGIDASVNETLAAQSRTQNFLKHYKHAVPAAR